jgi:hypothetical protein
MKKARAMVRVSTNHQDVKRQYSDLEKIRQEYGLEYVGATSWSCRA